MKNLIRFPFVPLLILATAPAVQGQEARPTSSDPAVGMVKFARSDLIKHPTGITVTLDGKLLAIESHTHFKPEDYEGNETDQIWWIEDSDGDGKADKRTLFFEADLVATMDIATHPETGAIYVATRNEILRLWDENEDGQADLERVDRRLVFLDTESSYPHDGCSGLTFDPAGNLSVWGRTWARPTP